MGRLASEIAPLLMGKHRPVYSQHMLLGDHVVVINAVNVKTTGRKEKQKIYYRHSGYPGGLKTKTLSELKKEQPEKIIIHAVSGMLPHNKLHDRMLKNLHVYKDSRHPYTKQASS